MFRSASQIDSERTASSLRRIKANWERTADNWFTGSVDSIDRRIALCERLIHQASQATARLLDRPESAHYMKLANDLQADHQALTQMRRDLLTAASDREAGHGVNCPQCGKLKDVTARQRMAYDPSEDHQSKYGPRHQWSAGDNMPDHGAKPALDYPDWGEDGRPTVQWDEGPSKGPGKHRSEAAAGDHWTYNSPGAKLLKQKLQESDERNPDGARWDEEKGWHDGVHVNPVKVKKPASVDPMRAYINWCQYNGLQRISARNVARFAGNDTRLCIHLAQRMRRAIHAASRRQAMDPAEQYFYDDTPNASYPQHKQLLPRTEDGDVVWPKTDEEWCQHYQNMDKEYGTDPDESPLGHNYRCPIHGTKHRRARRRTAAPDYLHDSEARLNHAHGPDGETYDGGPQYGFENRQDYRNRMKSSGHNIGGIPDEYNDDYGPLPDQDELRRQVYEDEHSGDDEPPTPQDILNFWELENRDPYGAPPRRRRH